MSAIRPSGNGWATILPPVLPAGGNRHDLAGPLQSTSLAMVTSSSYVSSSARGFSPGTTIVCHEFECVALLASTPSCGRGYVAVDPSLLTNVVAAASSRSSNVTYHQSFPLATKPSLSVPTVQVERGVAGIRTRTGSSNPVRPTLAISR